MLGAMLATERAQRFEKSRTTIGVGVTGLWLHVMLPPRSYVTIQSNQPPLNSMIGRRSKFIRATDRACAITVSRSTMHYTVALHCSQSRLMSTVFLLHVSQNEWRVRDSSPQNRFARRSRRANRELDRSRSARKTAWITILRNLRGLENHPRIKKSSAGPLQRQSGLCVAFLHTQRREPVGHARGCAPMNGPFCEGGTGVRRVLRHRS
jgi:hypothetical protein